MRSMMRNKVNWHNNGFVLLNYGEYIILMKNYNHTLGQMISLIEEKYPLVTETEIINALDSYSPDILAKYGIMAGDAASKANAKLLPFILLGNACFSLIISGLIIYFFERYNHQKDRELKEITNYIEEINRHNYTLKIKEISEDELSILKNEIYKITVMLKESAEQSEEAKKNLKKALEDISHQLKTPLTSILIILDNLIDNPKMPESMRQEFIHDIKRETTNINFLIQNLLKLSKFDANMITFEPKVVSLGKIIKAAQKNVAALCDLKNITLKTVALKENGIMADYNWEVEALTNILKNCLEHSKNNDLIEITYFGNAAYSEIKIIDHGEGIKKEDLPHIFERFYQGSNANNDSMGIGLALAQEIIKKDNGTINVASSKKGTTFTIKYFHY